MDIEKIISLLNSCLKKILNISLEGDQKQQKAYAFEYMLILIGERIREVIEEIEKFVLSDKDLLTQFLKDNNIEFESDKINSEKDTGYRKQKFRDALNNTGFGKNLMMLSQLRSRIEHLSHKLSEEEHTQFENSYSEVHYISNFLKNTGSPIHIKTNNPELKENPNKDKNTDETKNKSPGNK